MSYCRFTDGDVYAYETEGGVQFWVSGDNKALDRLCNTFDEAYRYVKELRDVHGLDVPSYAIESLKEDALEEAKRISGASGVIGELRDENARLRELVRDMWCCISHIGEYDVFYYDMAEDGCGMSCTVNGEHCCADKLHDRMRELGIEVSHDD